jgi:Ferritin-like
MTVDTTKKAELLGWLQRAIELELSTIPPYLVALLSIHPSADRAAAESIRSVLMEEMLHMALVANVASSIEGSVKVTRDSVPTYPLTFSFEGRVFSDREFPVDLAPFSKGSVETFMKIEQPARPVLETLGFEKVEVPAPTIGEFYAMIIARLEELETASPGAVFVGSPDRQIGIDYYWSAGGKPVVVRDLASAKAALQIVRHQGEGSPSSLNDGDETHFGQPFEVAHYFRFREIFVGRRYQQSDLPTEEPSGAPIEVDYGAVYPIIVNAKSKDYAVGSTHAKLNDAFNGHYATMLLQLEEAMNGNPKVLYTAIMNGMHNLTPLAREMMSTPIDGDAARRHGCPTFEWVEP